VVDGEVQRAHAVEIVVVQRVLGAHPAGQGRAEIARQGPDQRVQRPHLRHVQPPAALLQHVAQLGIDQGVQHDARLGLDLLEHPLELLGGADQGVDVLDRDDALEAGDHRLGHGVEGFARRVRDQVDVEIGRQPLGRGIRFLGFRCGQSGLAWAPKWEERP